jgi:tRNA threonylcarbamoyladenosine biosynthesis protein TsaE
MRPGLQLPMQRRSVDDMTPTHRPILESHAFDWPDESACAASARALARDPALHDACIELQGPLGAGKTTFVRHLLRALGVRGPIKSPTYALVEPYEVDGLAVSHFDFYRFADPREWADAGLRDVFAAPGLKLVEWPDQARGMLPVPDLRMELDALDDDRRRVTLHAHTARGLALLAAARR